MSVQNQGRDWLGEFAKLVVKRFDAMNNPVDPKVLAQIEREWEQFHSAMDATGVIIYPIASSASGPRDLDASFIQPIEFKGQTA